MGLFNKKEQPQPSGKWVKGKYVKTEPIKTELDTYTVVFEVAGIHYRMDKDISVRVSEKSLFIGDFNSP